MVVMNEAGQLTYGRNKTGKSCCPSYTYLPEGEVSEFEHSKMENFPGIVSWRKIMAARHEGSIDGRPHFPGEIYSMIAMCVKFLAVAPTLLALFCNPFHAKHSHYSSRLASTKSNTMNTLAKLIHLLSLLVTIFQLACCVSTRGPRARSWHHQGSW